MSGSASAADSKKADDDFEKPRGDPPQTPSSLTSPSASQEGAPAQSAAQRALPSSLMNTLAESSVVWLVLWFCLNVAVTLSNKALFQFSAFAFPITLSGCHMLSASIFSTLSVKTFRVPERTLTTQKEHVTMALFSVLFCANILTGNIGLRFVPVSLVQCVRSTTPGIAMVLSYLLLHKRYTRYHVASVASVVVGVAVTTWTTMDFHVVGFIFVVLVCFLSSLKSVVTSKFLVSAGLRFHPLDLLQRMSTYSLAQLLVLWILSGEGSSMMAWWAEHGSWKLAWLLFVNAFMAFFLNVTNFFFTKLTSALTVTVAGNVKHVATIAISIAMFKNQVTFMNAIGIIITAFGAAAYSTVDYKEAIRKGAKPSGV